MDLATIENDGHFDGSSSLRVLLRSKQTLNHICCVHGEGRQELMVASFQKSIKPRSIGQVNVNISSTKSADSSEPAIVYESDEMVVC